MNANKLGLYCSSFGIAFWLILVFGLIIKLPIKLPTLILLSWPILPGIIGGFIFYNLDKSDSWK